MLVCVWAWMGWGIIAYLLFGLFAPTEIIIWPFLKVLDNDSQGAAKSAVSAFRGSSGFLAVSLDHEVRVAWFLFAHTKGTLWDYQPFFFKLLMCKEWSPLFFHPKVTNSLPASYTAVL